MPADRDPARRPLLLVEWIDSHSANTWRALDELARSAVPVHCRSIGWLAAESREAIVLVSSVSGERNANLRLYASGDITIPKRSITRRVKLRETRR